MVTSELRGLAIREPIGAAVTEPANTYVGGGAVDIGDDGEPPIGRDKNLKELKGKLWTWEHVCH